MAEASENGAVVRFEREEGVATLTLNRPEVLNALSADIWRALIGHLDAIAADREIRVVILRGEGRAFSAGNDLRSLAAAASGDARDAAQRRADRRLPVEAIGRIEALPQPVIAAIHGYCLTGALELVLACDLIVAAESTKIGDTHAKWGLVPGWGGNIRLPARVGLARAKEIAFTCRNFTARECLEMGLVNRVASDGQHEAAARELALEIAAHSAESVSRQKRIMNVGARGTVCEGLAWIQDFHPGSASDSAERLARFGRG